MSHGYFRTAAAVPTLKPADVQYNCGIIADLMGKAKHEEASLVLFPELAITGYTCADLFLQDQLLDAAEKALFALAEKSGELDICTVLSLPLRGEGMLWDCAAVLAKGKVAGIVPKSYLPNYKEFYERRWFSAAAGLAQEEIRLGNRSYPFGTDLLFRAEAEGQRPFLFGLEICEDLWVPLPPSTILALRGAVLILNPSASTEFVGKADYRRSLVCDQSARSVSAYLYADCGPGESTTDVVYSGHCIAAEYGSLLAESRRFARNSQLITVDFDVARLEGERRRLSTFGDQANLVQRGQLSTLAASGLAKPQTERIIPIAMPKPGSRFDRSVDRRPFVPEKGEKRDERCREVFSLQTAGLAKRIEHTGVKKVVIGVSGGLDSTLALLVAAKTLELLGRPHADILAVTMPGFGTTGRTLENARSLMKQLGTETREIDIKAACLGHFADIGHDAAVHDVTYENVQARERTQVLMDLANKVGGMVLGTGDLSEAALGWSTYNGDHMSMYAVNCSVPKTLVRHLVSWVAANEATEEAAQILKAVVETPISPELLPPDDQGNINQKTEESVGPYELQDFFLYHHVRWGESPDKIRFLAKRAFGPDYSEDDISRWLDLFYRRFFAQQFKRSCVPDGPKVGSISLSPRGDWRMPSDASSELWRQKD